MSGQIPELIAVDIGNSIVKWCPLRRDAHGSYQPGLLRSLPPHEFTLEEVFDQGAEIELLVASVNRATQKRLELSLHRRRPHAKLRLLSNDDLPIRTAVTHPERVGADRLLAAVGANQLRCPRRPALVIDAGTAITVDAVAANGTFLGGAILLGAAHTTQALYEAADMLPHVTVSLDNTEPAAIGPSTEGAITSGVYWGLVGAVRELVGRMEQELRSPPQLFVTGGDAERLANHLQAEAHLVVDLVMRGMALTASKLFCRKPNP